MKYQPILTDEGHIEPMNKEEAPSDIHEFIGYRLPDEVYYFLSRGVLGEATLNTLLWGHAAEYSPLCNGETEEYRTFLTTELLKIKSQTIALATAQLHPFYHRKVAITYWYDSNSTPEHVIKVDTVQSDIDAIGRWKSGKLSVEKELKKQGVRRKKKYLLVCFLIELPFVFPYVDHDYIFCPQQKIDRLAKLLILLVVAVQRQRSIFDSFSTTPGEGGPLDRTHQHPVATLVQAVAASFVH